MLIIQIAAGIILALVVLRFWKQSLWLAGGATVLIAIAFTVLWLTREPTTAGYVRDAAWGALIMACVIAVRVVADKKGRRSTPAVRLENPEL